MDKNDNKQAIAIAIRTSESLRYDLANGMGANRYAGLDRFGRIIDLAWRKAATGSSSSSSSSSNDASALVHLQYGYDRASNRTYRRDDVARSYGKNFDELYEYDGLNQLKKFYRGLLVDNNTVIESPALQQAWQFDATGNWSNFTSFDPADATKALDQQRLHNRVNEITEIARTVGANWITPAYDRNGNMTGDETGKVFVYDAWNRLVAVKDAEGATLKTYRYDGLNRRVRDDDGSDTKDLYYSTNWQVLEERVGGVAKTQYVWSPVYVDAMVVRDRDADGSSGNGLEERLYAQQDTNWNTTALVNMSGNVVERYAYDPFGAVTVYDSGYTVRTGGSSYGWVYLYQGRPLDSVSGTYDFRERVVSATLGRPLQMDPLGLGPDVNPYRWEGNDPVNRLDPTGLQDRRWGPRGDLGEGGFRGGLSFLPPLPPPPLPTVPGAVFWHGGWLLPCPKTLDDLNKLPDNPDYKGKVVKWPDHELVTKKYHAGAKETWRIRILGNPVDNQCGYDCNGKLITAGTGAGTADAYNADRFGHWLNDVLPWHLRRHKDIDDYHKIRPPVHPPDTPPNRVDVIPYYKDPAATNPGHYRNRLP